MSATLPEDFQTEPQIVLVWAQTPVVAVHRPDHMFCKPLVRFISLSTEFCSTMAADSQANKAYTHTQAQTGRGVCLKVNSKRNTPHTYCQVRVMNSNKLLTLKTKFP